MVLVFGMPMEEDTLETIDSILFSEKLTKFSKDNKLLLTRAAVVRIAILHLIHSLPTKEQVNLYRPGLKSSTEFHMILKIVRDELK